jgi:hypothetical protein
MKNTPSQAVLLRAKVARKENALDPDWVRMTDEIKAVTNAPLGINPYGITARTLLDEFLDHLPIEWIKAIWFCIRYDYKICDEAIAVPSPETNASGKAIREAMAKYRRLLSELERIEKTATESSNLTKPSELLTRDTQGMENTLIPFEDVAEHFTVVEGYGDELTHDDKE